MIDSLLILYTGLPYVIERKLTISTASSVLFAVFAVTQMPLDWDLDTAWQLYPFPILLSTEIGHSLGLAASLFLPRRQRR